MNKHCVIRFLAVLSALLISSLGLVLTASAQVNQAVAAGQASGQPIVIHIHHHYYTSASSFTRQAATMPDTSLLYPAGHQDVLGAYVAPWKQNWDHLGFTGYLGQQSDISGLVVDTITPNSPATQMGLVVGDFILSINGSKVDGYRQVAVLFEETREDPKHRISMVVWNPHTRRQNTVRAVLEGLTPKKKPDGEEYPPEE